MRIKTLAICVLVTVLGFILMKTNTPPEPEPLIYYKTAGVFAVCLLLSLLWSESP